MADCGDTPLRLKPDPHAQSPPRARLVAFETRRRAAPLRLPFHFSSVTMTELEVLVLQVTLELEGGICARGCSGAVLSPHWFDRREGVTLAAKRDALLASVHASLRAAGELEARPLIELHAAAESGSVAETERRGAAELVASFGPALLDWAAADALLRARACTLHEALSQDLFGAGPVPGLPAEPARGIAARHTVGLADPLRTSEVKEAPDGLPSSLEEVLARYGQRWLKVKIGADIEANLERLVELDRLCAELAPDYAMTLDGNESFASAEVLLEFVERFVADPRLERARQRTAWIEQPLPRERALEPEVSRALGSFPVILDESDASDRVVEEGLRLGYHGVSIKGCKGLYRSLHAARTVQRWNAARAGSSAPVAFISAEDLTCVGPEALHPDLALAASLGVPHCERNGHHYVRGLAVCSQAESLRLHQRHPDLYARTGDLVHLAIRDGQLDLGTIVRATDGLAGDPDLDALEPLELPPPAPGP